MTGRDILHPHKKKAKHLFSGKSYNDLSLAAESNMLTDSTDSSLRSSPVPRAHSFGSSASHVATHRIALMASYPTEPDAYELINKCGHGATAEVWRAKCKSLGDDVAIKIVDLDRAGRSMETIIHEAQLLRSLRHKHIVPLLACFIKGETLWMVLPYVQGGSVESAMKYAYPKGLPERIIAPIVLPILKALAYLHKHDIAHRDVKASNILLGRNNILLGDFGTAVEMERSMGSGGKAAFGHYLARTTYVGTPHWMAPEVIEQMVEGHCPKADIYSFGVTMLEMARGKVPFAGMPLEVVAMNKLHHPSPSLPSSYEGRSFSSEMQEVVGLCLEKDPMKRPSAEQLLKHRFFKWVRSPRDALDELLNGVPGPVQRLSSLTRRSTENSLIGGDEAASYQADERVSLKTQKSKEAKWATKFDAEAALGLLHKMLIPMGVVTQAPDNTGDSPESSNVGSVTSSLTAAPGSTRRLSFTKKKSSVALGPLWPSLPPQALKFCRGILFASASRRGFGLQTFWGHAFILAHLDLGEGKTCWSGPCYCYISAGTHVGLGDATRESIVLYSGKSFHKRATSGTAFKLSGMQLTDAVEENLALEAICDLLKDESSPCEGVAFRHYTGGKSWKNIPGVVHMDHVANEKLYGKPVEPGDILDGKIAPPNSFKQLIDALNAAEEGKIETRLSGYDSDVSSSGVHIALEHDVSIGSAMSGTKVGGSPATSPRDVDTAFHQGSIKFEGPDPPLSSFADSLTLDRLDYKHQLFPGQESRSYDQSPDPISFETWLGTEFDDNNGTPPPDYLLYSPEQPVQQEPKPCIRRAKSDGSSLTKGDSALDLASLIEGVRVQKLSDGMLEQPNVKTVRVGTPEEYYHDVVESFRHASPFASSSSQALHTPATEDQYLDLAKRNSRPLSPSSTMLKPPKHPRSLSTSMNGVKL